MYLILVLLSRSESRNGGCLTLSSLAMIFLSKKLAPRLDAGKWFFFRILSCINSQMMIWWLYLRKSWRLPYRQCANCTHHKRVQTLCFPVGQFWSGLTAHSADWQPQQVRQLTKKRRIYLFNKLSDPKFTWSVGWNFWSSHISAGRFFFPDQFASEAGGIKRSMYSSRPQRSRWNFQSTYVGFKKRRFYSSHMD